MGDEQKTREQLLSELKVLRQEVDQLRVLAADYQAAGHRPPLMPEELEERITEYLGWF